ncbi:MAG: hypothetical protein SGPRY_009949, partial [Prymnesium sp.]
MSLGALDYSPRGAGGGWREAESVGLGASLGEGLQLPDPMERCEGAAELVKMVHGTTTLAFKFQGGVVVA